MIVLQFHCGVLPIEQLVPSGWYIPDILRENIFFSKRRDLLWGPPSLFFNRYRGSFHPESSLRVSGVVSLFPWVCVMSMNVLMCEYSSYNNNGSTRFCLRYVTWICIIYICIYIYILFWVYIYIYLFIISI